ncbi:TetR/AcrR family transcriptional regulator [Kribbella pittospori]|uniref:TetR/AcrR family transcriptional regulator n=1 Tax=Kribbella pittospori TaxID=722689 RepID=A0A4R0JWB9_9ACTN|nr:TetR/AcrR family transcriptional regulator [Kribbella pittospori]TCC49546.1 TetR/AcrR family transcriptional regulator [Kribbella pittospori]
MSDRPDARMARTDRALEDAVLRLASGRPVSRISVAELTQTAGVTRPTFYHRFRSPLELLLAVLDADLAELYRHEDEWRTQEGLSSDEALRRATGAIVDHVVRFAGIYRQTLENPADRGVYDALVRHFSDYSLAFMAASANVPDGDRELMAQFVSHGFAGAIKAWLADDRLSRDELVDAVVACAPAWWH